MDGFKEYKHQDFLEEETMLDCKNLAEFVHKSSVAKMMLEHECEETGHFSKSIPQANDTR